MLESMEQRNRRPDTLYDMQEPEDITISLVKLSKLPLHDFLANEPDICTLSDLKVRYR